jgi:hypothetical protein
MKMKRMWALLAVAGLLFATGPSWANTCPRLVREGRDLLAKASLPAEQSKKIQGLLDEAQKLHQGGNHGDAMTKANEALDLLKKK